MTPQPGELVRVKSRHRLGEVAVVQTDPLVLDLLNDSPANIEWDPDDIISLEEYPKRKAALESRVAQQKRSSHKQGIRRGK